MNKSFDELFDEFLNNDNNGDKTNNNPLIGDELIKYLQSIEDMDNIDEIMELEIDNKLGEPDNIDFFIGADGLYYEKRVWNTSKGDFIKLIIRENNTNNEDILNNKTLEELLDDAISEERFEDAAKFRDLIENNKNNN